jgi:hypothetical protein
LYAWNSPHYNQAQPVRACLNHDISSFSKLSGLRYALAGYLEPGINLIILKYTSRPEVNSGAAKTMFVTGILVVDIQAGGPMGTKVVVGIAVARKVTVMSCSI